MSESNPGWTGPPNRSADAGGKDAPGYRCAHPGYGLFCDHSGFALVFIRLGVLMEKISRMLESWTNYVLYGAAKLLFIGVGGWSALRGAIIILTQVGEWFKTAMWAPVSLYEFMGYRPADLVDARGIEVILKALPASVVLIAIGLMGLVGFIWITAMEDNSTDKMKRRWAAEDARRDAKRG